MAKVALPRQNCFLRLRIRVEEKPPCIKFKYRVDKIKLVFDHGGELYKSEKYQHVEESRMLAICKTLISFTMALNLSSIYSDQRVKRVLLHLVPSPPLPLLPCFTGSTIFTSSHCKQAMLGFVSTSLALSCYSTIPDAPLFHLSLPEK